MSTKPETERSELSKRIEELTRRFSEGWHDGIKIDASDIATLSEAAALLAEDGKAGGEVVADAFENLKSSTALADAYIDLWQKYRALQRSQQAAQVAQPLTDEQWQEIADITGSVITRRDKDAIEEILGIGKDQP